MKRNVLAAQENAVLCCVTSNYLPIPVKVRTTRTPSSRHHGNKILTRCENEVIVEEKGQPGAGQAERR